MRISGLAWRRCWLVWSSVAPAGSQLTLRREGIRFVEPEAAPLELNQRKPVGQAFFTTSGTRSAGRRVLRRHEPRRARSVGAGGFLIRLADVAFVRQVH